MKYKYGVRVAVPHNETGKSPGLGKLEDKPPVGVVPVADRLPQGQHGLLHLLLQFAQLFLGGVDLLA